MMTVLFYILKIIKADMAREFYVKMRSAKAQATTELALFGTIMLVIFAALMRYAIIFNAQQSAEMFAFREACKVAKSRHAGWGPFDMQYAAANINVQKHVFPPNVFSGPAPQDSTTVGAGASVTCENQGALFMPEVDPDDWFMVTSLTMQPENRHYVIGPNNEPLTPLPFFYPGLMLTMRSSNDKLPRSGVDGMMDMLNGKLKPGKVVFSWEPVPYRDQTQNTTTTYESTYQTQEEEDRSTYREQGNTVVAANTRYIGPDTTDIIKMILEDPDMLFAMPISKDMTVNVEQTITQDRTWETPN